MDDQRQSSQIRKLDSTLHGHDQSGEPKTKARFGIVALVTLCATVCYISRLNLSLAIVAMINNDEPIKVGSNATIIESNNLTSLSLNIDRIDTSSGSCPTESHNVDNKNSTTISKTNTVAHKYNWTNEQVAHIQSAFFWTYVICQIPVTRRAEIIGPKWILTMAGLGSGLFSLLAPLASETSALTLALTRYGMGACQTALYPASYIVYTRWLPSDERSFALTLLYMGAYIGSTISSSLTGYLCESPNWGWPWVFYLSGIVCLVWSVFWIIFGSNEPNLNNFREFAHVESDQIPITNSDTTIKNKNEHNRDRNEAQKT